MRNGELRIKMVMNEIKETLRNINSGKATGEDQIESEIIK